LTCRFSVRRPSGLFSLRDVGFALTHRQVDGVVILYALVLDAEPILSFPRPLIRLVWVLAGLVRWPGYDPCVQVGRCCQGMGWPLGGPLFRLAAIRRIGRELEGCGERHRSCEKR
jgi:hypothetical protein